MLYLDTRLFVFERGSGRERLVVAYNNSDEDIRILFDKEQRELVSGVRTAELVLPPFTTYVFESDTDNFRIYFS